MNSMFGLGFFEVVESATNKRKTAGVISPTSFFVGQDSKGEMKVFVSE